ncbi:MAG: hypothetical protein MZV70_30525 [Desulfobacterales bacterium]|nr:hypothetical protein [Desulfobacterales bacterium]
MGRTLLFVYNNSSEILPKIKDYASKKAIHETDRCNLYDITHTPIGMKELETVYYGIGIPVRMLNGNEFSSEFGSGLVTCPVALLQMGKDLTIFIRTDEAQALCRY